MLKHYIKRSLREIVSNKYLTVLKILGLSIGLTFSMVLGYKIIYELSFDTFQDDCQRKYEMQIHDIRGDTYFGTNFTNKMMQDLKNIYPNLKGSANIYKRGEHAFRLENNDKVKIESVLGFVNPGFFEFNSIEFILGKHRFDEINLAIVLSKSTAIKWFGTTNVIGKEVEISIYNKLETYTITGVIDDMPQNSVFNTDVLISQGFDKRRYYNDYVSYLYLSKGASEELLKESIHRVLEKREYKFSEATPPTIKLTRISEIRKGDHQRKKIYIYFSLLCLMIIISVINYILLVSVQFLQKTKDIGVQIVLGSSKWKVIIGFVVSTIIQMLLAFILSGLTIMIFENQITDMLGVSFNAQINIWSLLLSIISLFVIVLVSLSLSHFFMLRRKSIINLFFTVIKAGKSNRVIFNSLIFFQIFSFLFLFSIAIVVSKQINLFLKSDQGFISEGLIYVDKLGTSAAKSQMFKDMMLSESVVTSASVTSSVPFCIDGNLSINANQDSLTNEYITHYIERVYCDNDFFRVLQTEFISGSNFSSKETKYIVNEAYYEKWGFKNVTNSQRGLDSTCAIGIVKTYNKRHSNQKISNDAVIFFNDLNNEDFYGLALLLRFKGSPKELIEKAKLYYDQLYPNLVFEYNFVDKKIKQVYKEEIRFGKIINWMTFFSILIACLGLLGISYFKALIRQKEIGIRKVNGATTHEILNLFNRQYVWQFILAFVLSIPLVIYIGNWWLEGFSSHVDIEIWVFVLTFIVAGLIVFGTISLHAYRAARRNPVKSLRYE